MYKIHCFSGLQGSHVQSILSNSVGCRGWRCRWVFAARVAGRGRIASRCADRALCGLGGSEAERGDAGVLASVAANRTLLAPRLCQERGESGLAGSPPSSLPESEGAWPVGPGVSREVCLRFYIHTLVKRNTFYFPSAQRPGRWESNTGIVINL